MTVTEVTTTKFISDTTILIRDTLLANITDPISASRNAGEKFVMTSHPQRPVNYPVIIVNNVNIQDTQRLGMQSELHYVRMPLEIRVWARNVIERDTLTEQVINYLRGFELGATSSTVANLHDFSISSSLNVDEQTELSGQKIIRSKIIVVEYFFILGA